ncbi:hypothetical protein OAP63_14620 [Vibrio sp.]|uniref:Uncharacterized protein n=1 Tax=Vibrio viridaestus TaxID=2487322 RepID=A0A3N9TLM6_9VIBR|nr:hypothetical protein [Vibrio viridaestus]MDC0611963.1 hypothetical protein [Vibrio sp.]RQW64894.1 hypothetical protein EES38_02325 [Vibrio viridaestus]
MAVVPKHNDRNKKYDPKDDLTLDQIHRFTKVANHVQHERDEQEVIDRLSGTTQEALEETIEQKEEEFVQQQIEQAKTHKKRRRSKKFAYASLALSLAILSVAIMMLFG